MALLDVAAFVADPAGQHPVTLAALAVGALVILGLVAYAVVNGWDPSPRPVRVRRASLDELLAEDRHERAEGAR